MKSTSRASALKTLLIPLSVILITIAGYYLLQFFWRGSSYRSRQVISWIRDPKSHPEWGMYPLTRCFSSTPFLFPTEGMIGYLWDDSFRPGHRHQGMDIFTSGEIGETPIYAAYGGFLSRELDWKSSLIIRIPDDPLHPGRQIWTYYTHMADQDGHSFILEDFPPGTTEVYVEEGTLLGYQGNYSGTPGNPVGIHLHFSIVKDDGNGHYLNELKIENTLDPSAYFNLDLNGKTNQDHVPACRPQ
jgi:hypothetical protein